MTLPIGSDPGTPPSLDASSSEAPSTASATRSRKRSHSLTIEVIVEDAKRRRGDEDTEGGRSTSRRLTRAAARSRSSSTIRTDDVNFDVPLDEATEEEQPLPSKRRRAVSRKVTDYTVTDGPATPRLQVRTSTNLPEVPTTPTTRRSRRSSVRNDAAPRTPRLSRRTSALRIKAQDLEGMETAQDVNADDGPVAAGPLESEENEESAATPTKLNTSILVLSDSDDSIPLSTKRKLRLPSMKGKGKIISDDEVSSLSEVDTGSFDFEDNVSENGAGPSQPSKPKRSVGARKGAKQKAPARRRTTIRSNSNVDENDDSDEPLSVRKASASRRKPAVVSDDSDSDFDLGSVRLSDAEAEEEAEDEETEETAAPISAPPTRRRRGRGAAAAARRQAKKDTKGTYDFHPELVTVWEQLEKEVQVIVPQQAEQPQDVNVKLLPFQREGLFWLLEQERGRFGGGILADEMGMGKTIQMISLLVSKRMKPNLILSPTVAIMQWLAELRERTTPGTFKVLLFHGNNRPTTREEVESYDVVLSTYAIIEQGFRKMQYGFKRKGETIKEPSLLHSVNWARVVLDEAHAIKDRSCSTARAVFALKRQKQWSLSGTPLQNRVGELYSLIRFMNCDPFSYYFCKKCPCKMQTWSFTDRKHCDGCGHISHQHFCWWNSEILKPIQKYGAEGEGLVGFKKLGCLLDRIMLRRTKLERTEELGLPPRVVTVRRDVFNDAEEELYESLYSDSARTFSTYVSNHTVLNNYASIFSLLSRMRLAVNHPDLVTTRVAIASNTATEHLVCGICHEEAEDPIMSKCKHVFCREDARQYIQSAPDEDTPTCPMCYKPLTIDLSQPQVIPKSGGEGIKSSIVNYIDMAKWRSSSKIEALVEELTALQRDDSTSKSIVFSQFVAFLDLIQWRLSRAGFNVVKLDGRMAPQQRDTVIKSFMTDPTVTVFLVSLKAGGVALNLTEASRVFVMDPWWNPAVEDQAFDRIHRLGQYRPIKITRMIIENSIESRILQLQEKKKALFESTVGKDMDALAKLSEEDLRFLFVL
ncbi:uncharacterized protein SPPG_04971 [Spizellomyces punctatus DAOM BR117]|uniref:DNA repair protein RAD16 n=1 Tax=Spizellomyces punctatus (strain DAOM BR117) TaxID=645134 RepID=A0A0L0HFN6_SPIPD|nr:uncharacterized protein SPPG_04971 [Spizellomyces punctatus DAOM BR117]KNC99583.1 hypothetical protein SPPG_04971 [Spizellomyces punctatus DAOM BR117]|eukprot:XP_016607623.1 hypothetical protein SPPG_04971 [Spizellomyces punctatus DAOM BR117]